MTILKKDQAIYKAMLEIANEVFNSTVENNKNLKSLISQYGGVISLNELTRANGEFQRAFFCADNSEACDKDYKIEDIDGFSCGLRGGSVFEHLKIQKSFAKVKGDVVFTYEKKIENKFVGSVEVSIGDGNNAKLLTNHAAKDELRPVMSLVLMEINATTETVSFVASDGHSLGVISNNPDVVLSDDGKSGTIFRGVFTKDDWKRICDYSKKNGNKVDVDIYLRKDLECFDTFNIHLGDIILTSKQENMRYPNWKSVIPDKENLKHSYFIVPEERKAAREWIRKHDNGMNFVRIYFYRGSNLVYFHVTDYDFSTDYTETFHLTSPSKSTTRLIYRLSNLKKVKLNGFRFGDPQRATLLDCEEADIMLLMPSLPSDNSEFIPDCESREQEYALSVGEYAEMSTRSGDKAIVRIEAINGNEKTACVRTVGWNRYRVPLSTLEPTYEANYSWPKWLRKGTYIESDIVKGTITDLGRTYIIIDNQKAFNYLEILNSFAPAEKNAKVVEMKVA